MPREAYSEGFFNSNVGSDSYRNHTTTARVRGRGRGRRRGSNRIVEDGQPNDSLSRNQDNIPSIRATYRPYRHVRQRGTSVPQSRGTSYHPMLKNNPPIGPRAMGPRAFSSMTTANIPNNPAAKRPSMDDLAPRKRRRTESPSLITPNTHMNPAFLTSASHEHSLPSVACPRPCATVADAAIRCGPVQLDSPANPKRESSPVDIGSPMSVGLYPPSPPLFKKLGLPAKTSGSYHVPMIDQCKKGAVLYMERRQEWKDSLINAVRFVRGHDFPPLTIERCFIRSDGMTIDWAVSNEASPNINAISSGFASNTIPAPTYPPSTTPSPTVGRAAPPPIHRLAPLPTSALARPIGSPLVGVSNVDGAPVGPISSSTRCTSRTLPKGIAKDALPVKVIDVPEYLLLKKDRDEWRKRVIIELGNPNYKGAFASILWKGPGGKGGGSGRELHIYDAGENPLAPRKEIHQESLKDNAADPTMNMSQTIEETSDAENHSMDIPIPTQRTKTPADQNGTLFGVLESLTHQKSPPFALAPRRSVSPENTTEHNRIPASQGGNFAQQRAPQFYSPTTLATNEASTSAVQTRKHLSSRRQSVSSTSFATIAPFGTSSEAIQPTSVAPMRLSRTKLLPEEPVLSSANISSPPIKPGPDSGPILAPPSGSPEAVSPRPPSRSATQAEPSHSLSRIEFDSSFCSGSNAVESLYEIARGFLRRFFGYLDSTEKARISGGYSEEAIMSWQLNDLPSVGVCPQVGNPQAQVHQITEVPRRVVRNLLLQGQKPRRPVCGKTDIIKRLETMADLKLASSLDCDPEYEYEALDLGIGGLVQVRCWGNLQKMIDDEAHIALRFERTFILEKNYGATKFVWPWVVRNDQMTLFHRPGIVCQCLSGRWTQSYSTSRV